MSAGNSTWTATAGGGTQTTNAAQLARALAQLGICSSGAPNALLSPGDTSTIRTQAGVGPLAEAAAFCTIGGMPSYMVPINASLAGALGSVASVGSGNAVVSAAAAPHVPVTAKVSTAGALGTMAVQLSVNGGPYGAPIVSSGSGPWTQLALGTFCVMSFPSGTYVLGDTYTVGIDGVVTHSGSGSPTVTQTSSPVDAYEFFLSVASVGGFGLGSFLVSPDGGPAPNGGGSTMGQYLVPSNGKLILPGVGVVLTIGQHTVLVTITTGGALGTAIFSYAVDGGTAVTGNATTPNSNGSFVFLVPGTGITLTFPAGTYVMNDTYADSALGVITHTGTGTPTLTQSWAGLQLNDSFAFLTVGVGHSTTDLNNAMQALVAARNFQVSGVHLVTMPSSAANAVSAQATLDAAIAAAYTNSNLDWEAMCECPHASGRGGLGDIVLSGGAAIADTADIDSVVSAARGSDTNRTAIHVASYRMTSALSGWKLARPFGWALAYMFVRTDPGTDLSAVKNGPLPIYLPPGATTIGRDESLTPGLDNVQFNTARTYNGVLNQVFLTISAGGAGWKNCTTQADWQDARGVRVLNIMTVQLRPVALQFLGDSPPVNPDGTIEEFTRRAWSTTLDNVAKRGVGLIVGGPFVTRQASFASANVLASSQLGQSPKLLLIAYVLQQLGFVSGIQNSVFFSGTLAIQQ